MKKVQIGRTYVGVVEDNQDPQKQGRVKVRVMDVFDNLKLQGWIYSFFQGWIF